MQIEQYVYFAIGSEVITPAELARAIGLAPDETQLRGATCEQPPRPVMNTWRLECRSPGLGIDAMISDVVARALPFGERIRRLVRAPDNDVVAWLQIVRYFDLDGGEEERIDLSPEGLLKLAGRHQLLGWHLDRELLEFLDDVGAELDADEYE